MGLVSTAKYFAPRMISAFAREHPNVKVSLTVGNREQVIQRCANSPSTSPSWAARRPGLRRRRHRRSSASDRRRPGPSGCAQAPDRSPRGWRRKPSSCANPGPHAGLMENLFRARRRAPHYGLEIDSNETIKQAVMAGLGVAFISAHTVDAELAGKRLVRLDIAGLPIVRQWFVMRRLDRRQLPAARAMAGLRRPPRRLSSGIEPGARSSELQEPR